MQIRLTTLTLITTLAVPYIAQAGGPIITEEPPIADVRPQGDGGSWVVPVIVGAIVLCAIACGGGDDSPIAPEPTCNGDGDGGPVC
jgi:hypothetical protein